MLSQAKCLLKFRRYRGVHAHLGDGFNRDLTLLVSLRCYRLYKAKTIKHYSVLENVNDVGAFSDVIVRIEYVENGCLKKKLLCVKADPARIDTPNLDKSTSHTNETEKPEIYKYYHSICLIA
jgi:hypothetical protein